MSIVEPLLGAMHDARRGITPSTLSRAGDNHKSSQSCVYFPRQRNSTPNSEISTRCASINPTQPPTQTPPQIPSQPHHKVWLSFTSSHHTETRLFAKGNAISELTLSVESSAMLSGSYSATSSFVSESFFSFKKISFPPRTISGRHI